MQLAQRTTKRFNFAFIGELLTFREFHQLQDLLHLIHRMLEGIDYLHDLVNRLADGSSPMNGFGMGMADTLG